MASLRKSRLVLRPLRALDEADTGVTWWVATLCFKT